MGHNALETQLFSHLRKALHATTQRRMQVIHHGQLHAGRARPCVARISRQRFGRLAHRWHLHQTIPRSGLGHLPKQSHRLRLPGIQPHSPSNHSGKCGIGPHAFGRVACGATRASMRGARAGRPSRAYQQKAKPAFWRPNAARRHCSRPGQRA